MSETAILPPHDISAELAILGSVLFDASVLERCDEIISPADFYDAINGAVFEACLSLSRAGVTVDGITVSNALKAHEGFAAIGGGRWLMGLLEYAAHTPEVRDYAQIIAEASHKRRVMLAARDLLAGVADDLAGALSAHETALDGVRASMTGQVDVSDLASAGLSGLEDREARLARKTPLGIGALDHTLIGLERGAVTVLAARPSMGKTALGTALAVNMAKAGRTIGYFSLEMPKAAIGLRAGSTLCFNRLAPQSSPKYFDVERGSAPEHHEAAIREALRRPFLQRVFVDDRGALRPQQLSAAFRSWETRARRLGFERPSVVVIDHMGHVQPDASRKSRTEDMGDVSKALLAFAKRHDVAVLALAQLNRSSVSEGRRPGLHDLRQSGEIEEDAHAVMFLHREEYYAWRAVNDGLVDTIGRASFG